MSLGFGGILYRQGGRMPPFQIEPKETCVRSEQNESGEYKTVILACSESLWIDEIE